VFGGIADRLLADDYVFLQADGQVSSKAQNIAVLRDPAFVCESLVTEGTQPTVRGGRWREAVVERRRGPGTRALAAHPRWSAGRPQRSAG